MEFKYEKINGDINYIVMEFSKDDITYGIGVEENTSIKEVLKKLERKINQQINKGGK